eukprot:jgi/Tetstr1/439628/TSEL_028050.t1
MYKKEGNVRGYLVRHYFQDEGKDGQGEAWHQSKLGRYYQAGKCPLADVTFKGEEEVSEVTPHREAADCGREGVANGVSSRKSSLTPAEKTPRAYEYIADLRDCVRRNEMLPLNPADSDAALGRDVGAGGGAGFASRGLGFRAPSAEMRVGEAEMRHGHVKMWPCDSHQRHPKAPDGLTWLRVSA